MQQNYSNYQASIPMQYAPLYGQMQQPQNPYSERLSQLQAMQQSMQPLQQNVFLNGRVVDSFDSITASDVPMNGTLAIFPKGDMTQICVKYWTGEGKIATMLFEPSSSMQFETAIKNETQEIKELNEVLSNVYAKVNDLSDKVDEVLRNRNNTRGNKKEVNASE